MRKPFVFACIEMKASRKPDLENAKKNHHARRKKTPNTEGIEAFWFRAFTRPSGVMAFLRERVGYQPRAAIIEVAGRAP